MTRRRAVPILAALIAAATPSAAAPALSVVATSPDLAWNGVAAAPDGRIFVEFPRLGTTPNPSVARLMPDGHLVPYPGGGWNDWHHGAPPEHQFVSTNAIHLGPDDTLWVVDNGAVGLVGHHPVPHAQKLVAIDLHTDRVVRVLPIAPSALRPDSAIDDIRFNGTHAYVTDAGAPGLIVVDLPTGAMRRVLDDAPSTTASRPALVDGHILRGPDGKPARINADQLEVSPDGSELYLQPLPGPLYRVPTRLLDDPATPPAALNRAVEFWYDTPSLGGTAIDPAGNLYLCDLASNAILRLTPDRHLSLVIRDPRLHWPDAPAFDPAGKGASPLLIPVPQLDRSVAFNHNHDDIHWPVLLLRLSR